MLRKKSKRRMPLEPEADPRPSRTG
jgi:hypothetical protein